ncbi:von Willebrand factor D and EGF domain-containing protein [Lingula anatina]|uniref:von Willebrand factor D and EGF domain-containing protein n=1 Tax=Lingula anatina TaxID=7574 RepID=A0A1S3IU93_LINAN|nr:von Willebrand factor D and EGF domain-containing protein [Lingula anatina]|eukprot:XP_013401777.1 von Willebrand factor D and EGF domain-containing protein [Lingula anatina]
MAKLPFEKGFTCVVFVFISQWITETNGFCADYGCCPGQDDGCRTRAGCMCDEHCLIASDCCKDYKSVCQEFNPCVQHTVRKDEVTRSSTFLSELPINCDNHLNNSWYRFDMLTGSTMPTTCIVHGNCGTERPIWLNDSHPDEEEGVVNRTACMKETGNCCAKSYDIQIKNCSTFMVYRLPSVSDCPERYCIGDKVLCPPGHTSETGFQPGCTDVFPNITQIPEVSVGEGIRQNQWGKRFKEIVFKCDQQYGQIAEEKRGELFFDVYWFFDGKKILEDEDMPTKNMPATLKESHWVGKHSLGFKVKCTVRAKFMKNGIIHGGRSAPLKSEEFFAGLKVLNTLPIVLKESDVVSTEIRLQPTVPVLCSDLKLQSYCHEQLLPVEIRIPLVPKKRLCSSGERLEFVSEFERTPCRLEINAMNWNKTHTFKIAPVVDGVYDGHTNTKVMVHTGEFTTHPAWNDYTLPDIPVTVLDTDVDAIGQVCMSNNDPHMRTFDGNNYECQYGGEFVLYKHTTLPVQVHAFFKPCNGGYAYCNCAVSVMSGGDVFIVDTCKPGTGLEQITAKRPMRVGLVGCEDGQLRVESLNGGKHFKVYLPTGGYVDIMVYRYGHDDFMNVQIHPGAKDFNRTVGLCGTLNHNKSDDFLTRDGRTEPVSSYPKDFAMSWRVQPQYSIYNGPPSSQLQFSKRSTSRSNYCRCSAETNDANSIVQCGNAENIAKCPGDDNFSSREHQKCRRRRAAEESGEGHDDVLETRVFEYDIYHTVPAPSWKNSWTNATAAQFCESFMANTSTGKSCETVPGANTRDPIKGCIEDIYLTGSTEWAPAALQAIKSSCLGELEKNPSIWVINNETGKVSLPKEMEAVQCPNECSGNGQCINGTCSCDDTFAGADCSIDISAAPTIYYLPGDGLCKTRSRPCARSPVYGGTFLDNKNLTCKVEIQEVLLRMTMSYLDQKYCSNTHIWHAYSLLMI